jgi:hypothetical protein
MDSEPFTMFGEQSSNLNTSLDDQVEEARSLRRMWLDLDLLSNMPTLQYERRLHTLLRTAATQAREVNGSNAKARVLSTYLHSVFVFASTACGPAFDRLDSSTKHGWLVGCDVRWQAPENDYSDDLEPTEFVPTFLLQASKKASSLSVLVWELHHDVAAFQAGTLAADVLLKKRRQIVDMANEVVHHTKQCFDWLQHIFMAATNRGSAVILTNLTFG